MKWAYFCLYVVLDLFSRFVVGWLIAARESAAIAQQLIAESYVRQGLAPNQLSIHSDRGGLMIAGSLTALFDDLGITPSLARPRTPAARDNPYSEAQFKTVKYHPTFPDRFGCLLDARGWGQRLFHWYNYEHYHTAVLATPFIRPLFGHHRPRRQPEGKRSAPRSTPGTPSPSPPSALQAVTPLAPISVVLSPDADAPD